MFLYSLDRVLATLWLKILSSLQFDLYWCWEVTLACPSVSFLRLHAWYIVSFNKCKSVAFWHTVIMFEVCQQSNFFPLSSVLFLNLVVIKGVRFLSETIEKGSLEHQWCTWKTCGSAKQNRPHFMKSLYLWLHYFCLETHSLVSCIKVVRFSWCREISLSLWDANNEKHQNNKVCDKQLPVLWIKQTHFWRGCHDYIFNYSQMYIEKSNCLICLLLISVPLGLLSRMTLQA